MTLSVHGTNTLAVEVTNISRHGFWLFVDGDEYFLPFDEFPWFRTASVASILHVQRVHGEHFFWPELDVDLELESIRHPEQYPLKAQ